MITDCIEFRFNIAVKNTYTYTYAKVFGFLRLRKGIQGLVLASQPFFFYGFSFVLLVMQSALGSASVSALGSARAGVVLGGFVEIPGWLAAINDRCWPFHF